MNKALFPAKRSTVRYARAALAVLLAAAMASPSAYAGGRGRGQGHGHGHGHVGFGFGLFVAAPVIAYSLYRPYYQPAYSYPPVVYSPAPDPVYIEQAPPPPQYQSAPQAAPQAEQSWWYYCAASQSYYPYARQCPGGWQRVAPRPPA